MALSTSGIEGVLEVMRGPVSWQRNLAECLGFIVLAAEENLQWRR